MTASSLPVKRKIKRLDLTDGFPLTEPGELAYSRSRAADSQSAGWAHLLVRAEPPIPAEIFTGACLSNPLPPQPYGL
jgi:hypothetical protein